MQQFSKKSIEKQREESRRTQEEQNLRQEQLRLEGKKRTKKKRTIITVATIIFLLTVAMITYAALSPGKYDKFAKCLTEKGAVMYGENWCKYTNAQKGMFGKSFKYIDYKQTSDLKVRPTWVIDGKRYETVQSFQRLSALTGCKY